MPIFVRRDDWETEREFRAIQAIVFYFERLISLGVPSAGTWTPTATNAANLDASTVSEGQYIRIGNTVAFSIKVTANPTAAGVETRLGLSLPVASDFTADSECSGVAFSPTVAGQGAAVRADSSNNRMELVWVASSTNSHAMFAQGMYEVIE